MLRYLNHPVLHYGLLYLNRQRLGLLRFVCEDFPWTVWEFRPTSYFAPSGHCLSARLRWPCPAPMTSGSTRFG